MSLESIFTPEQIDALSKAPLDVAVLAAEADFELEDIELKELETQLTSYDGNEYVRELFLKAKILLDNEFLIDFIKILFTLKNFSFSRVLFI